MTLEQIYRSACRQGVNPHLFWESTLTEVQLLIEAGESKDRLMWNHTASLMSLYANSKSAKGKSFSPDDFNPYSHMERESNKPQTSDDVMDLMESMKSFNGK